MNHQCNYKDYISWDTESAPLECRRIINFKDFLSDQSHWGFSFWSQWLFLLNFRLKILTVTLDEKCQILTIVYLKCTPWRLHWECVWADTVGWIQVVRDVRFLKYWLYLKSRMPIQEETVSLHYPLGNGCPRPLLSTCSWV